MSAELAPTTRMAVQAAVVALAGILLSRLLPLERPYWIVLTGVVLINQTWGASVRRIVSRVAMTAVGCLVGWGLYQLAAHSLALQRAALLICVTLAVYFRAGLPERGYAGMVFFITVYIVFVFALLGNWSPGLVLARLYDTAIGCVLALAVSRLVLHRKAGQELESGLAGFWEECRQHFESAAPVLLDPKQAPPDLATARTALLSHLAQLRGQHGVSAYESLGQPPEQTRRAALVSRARLLSRYVLGFASGVQYARGRPVPPHLADWLRYTIEQARTTFVLLAAAPGSRNQAAPGDHGLVADLGQSREELLTFGPICYFLERILTVLQDLLGDHGESPA